ncbi:MAG TPA: AraC family transcriptional regulator [Roseiflexaceae bacterium]|nr:AraC family transcriptional regulator [Roseiflexaceae bacterium]
MLEELIERVRQLAASRAPRVTLYAPELQLFGGFEVREPPGQYHWDGMRRGGDPAHPYLIFQYTLDGWGCYAAHGVTHRLTPGMAFTAIIPSEHTYFLPPASSGWAFFWIILHHPYIVERIARRQQEGGAVLAATPDSPLVLRALDLLEQVCRPTLRDALAHERALFEFLWEHERGVRRGNPPASAGERLLEEVRRYVVESLARPIGVAELAARHGMSRSHFSHTFKAATGLAPAAFIQQTRLEEAARRLMHSDQPIAAVARATGFANANHFCKVFRRRFHLSPGAFRRQMRA